MLAVFSRHQLRRAELANPVAAGMGAVSIAGEEVRLPARREPSHRTAARRQPEPQQPARERQRSRESERRDPVPDRAARSS